MSEQKPPARRGFKKMMQAFMEALGNRYHRVLQVIDEALASDNLKDKIWAVDLILKRTPPVDPLPGQTVPNKGVELSAPEKLNDAELLERIRHHLRDEP